MKYLKVKVNRLWHGFCSVRSIQVDEAREKGLGLEIWWGDEFIHVPYDSLDKCFTNTDIFRSKHKEGQTYTLVDYDWSTWHKKTDIQEAMF